MLPILIEGAPSGFQSYNIDLSDGRSMSEPVATAEVLAPIKKLLEAHGWPLSLLLEQEETVPGQVPVDMSSAGKIFKIYWEGSATSFFATRNRHTPYDVYVNATGSEKGGTVVDHASMVFAPPTRTHDGALLINGMTRHLVGHGQPVESLQDPRLRPAHALRNVARAIAALPRGDVMPPNWLREVRPREVRNASDQR